MSGVCAGNQLLHVKEKTLASDGIKNGHFYFSMTRMIRTPTFRKQQPGLITRHELKLGISELVGATSYLLKPKGRVFLVHHPERLAAIIEELDKNMAVKRLRFVHPNPSSEAKMVLVEAIKDGRMGLKIERPFLCITAKAFTAKR